MSSGSTCFNRLDERVCRIYVTAQGFALDFVFEPNEFFSDTVLTKTYFLQNPANAGYDDLVYSHAEGYVFPPPPPVSAPSPSPSPSSAPSSSPSP